MSDEEFLANLNNIDNEKLIQSLQSCGHDGYYNDLYYPIVEEIKRRLSLSPSAEPERMKGKWMMDSDYPDRLICSECTGQFDVWHWESKQMHFCPNCGADMRGEYE